MSKFKLTQTATEVQNILNNSLQKPTGLSKTELVGVGVNGQENIEIGDNLTLANGKLSATGGGGGAITQHKVLFQNTGGDCRFFFFALSTTAPYRDQLVYEMDMDNINNWFLHGKERDFLATGYIRTDDGKIKPIVYVHVAPKEYSTRIYYLDTTSFIQQDISLPNGQWEVGESIAITTSN